MIWNSKIYPDYAFDVDMFRADYANSRKLQMVKAIKLTTGLDLKQSKELCEAIDENGMDWVLQQIYQYCTPTASGFAYTSPLEHFQNISKQAWQLAESMKIEKTKIPAFVIEVLKHMP